jgi:hypothetical protein
MNTLEQFKELRKYVSTIPADISLEESIKLGKQWDEVAKAIDRLLSGRSVDFHNVTSACLSEELQKLDLVVGIVGKSVTIFEFGRPSSVQGAINDALGKAQKELGFD